MKAFASYHPAFTAFYLISAIVSSFAVNNPVMKLTLLLGGALFYNRLQKRSERLENTIFYSLLFAMITAVIPLFWHNGVTPLFFINGNPVTAEAFAYSAAVACSAVSALIWCECFAGVMTSDRMLYVLGLIFPKMSLYISVILKYIPMMRRKAKRIERAQKALGLYSRGGAVDTVKKHADITASVCAGTIESSVTVGASMRSRGYGAKKRSCYKLFRFCLRDGICLCVYVILSAICIIAASGGDTVFYYYPRISGMPFSPSAMVAYISFAVISLIPFITEVKEELVWRYCVSRI